MSHVIYRPVRDILLRRDFFRRIGTTLGGLALGSLLPPPARATAMRYDVLPRQPHFPAKAKRVLLLFQNGGPSQVDLFDPKPELTRRSGEKPGPGFINTVDIKKTGAWLGTPFSFAPRGKCGMVLSELLPGLARHADQIALVRSMVSEHSNHEQAIWYFNTGSIQPGRPAMGSWVTYALGTENQSLPAFAAIMHPKGLPVDGVRNFSAGWMPPIYQGLAMRAEGTPVLNLTPQGSREAAAARFELLQQLNLKPRQDQLELEARIASFELAARMQLEASEALDLSREPQSMHDLYRTADAEAGIHGRQLLLARRLLERGVRFVQVLHEGQPWDTHKNNESGLRAICRRTDEPTAALLTDLKQRGLLDDTLVIWSGEFGRTPMAEGKDGRDHHKFGFSMWMAGGGIKGGVTYGGTDEFGYAAVENPVHMPDFHATVFHLLGLDYRKVSYFYETRDQKLTDVHQGRVVKEILA
jgi:uncharacterized protein (DUF1501 family)